MPKLRILHTADWHLGRDLAGVDRTQDFERFLAWLTDEVRTRRPDVLPGGGGTSSTPRCPRTPRRSSTTTSWRKIAETDVAAVIVTAGNHDSAYFLGAARPSLKASGAWCRAKAPKIRPCS